KLLSLGLKEEELVKLSGQGLASESDFIGLPLQEFMTATGLGLFVARRVIAAFNPPKVAEVTTPSHVPDVVPEGAEPSKAQLNGFADQIGMDPNLLTTFMMSGMFSNAGVDFNFGSMVPIGQIVKSYSPKIRNMTYLFMDQIQKSVGNVPIVAINADGSVNADLTAKYVLSLQEGFDPVENDIFYDEDGDSYQLIKVGVDAQSVYDADPLDSSKPLQKNGMGTGRVTWNKIPLDIRQMVFLAVNETGEIKSNDGAQVARLRDKIKVGVKRTDLQGDMPKAYTLYNEKLRTGALPTLRIQLSRSARQPEFMSRRRTRPEGGQPGSGSTFPEDK
ncbi:MAG TPA: hypothetical protein PLY70_16170, partial [Saprospiraceae bacterium]|nr:hypothetical protein [Saprospiraceae bacterium]